MLLIRKCSAKSGLASILYLLKGTITTENLPTSIHDMPVLFKSSKANSWTSRTKSSHKSLFRSQKTSLSKNLHRKSKNKLHRNLFGILKRQNKDKGQKNKTKLVKKTKKWLKEYQNLVQNKTSVANLTTNRKPRPLKIWISEVNFLREVKVFLKTLSIMILKSTEKIYLFFLSSLIDTKRWTKILERNTNQKSRTKNILKAISSGKVFLFKSKWISNFEAFQLG